MSTLKVDNLLNSAGNESPISVPGAAKAWVYFDGTTGTLNQNDVTIRGSYNVTSVTDGGTGRYVINFTNSFANTNYAFAAVAQTIDANDDGNCKIAMERKHNGDLRTTSDFPLDVSDWMNGFSGGLGDANSVCAVFFGD